MKKTQSEMFNSSKLVKLVWTQVVFFHLMVSGTLSTVHQPPVVSSLVGHDVVLQCWLNRSDNEKLLDSPVPYWDLLEQDGTKTRLYKPTEKYKNRVKLLDNNPDSFNKSILLKNVHWADSGEYLCKISVLTKKKTFREKGKTTLLIIYDTMTFKLTTNDSLLYCEVNVTWDPALVLSISHSYRGSKPESVQSASEDAAPALPYITLSKNMSVKDRGKYECQLHLNTHLITKSNFSYSPAGSENILEDDENVTVTPTSASDPYASMFPEPWPLYGSVLMVQVAFLLGVIIVQMCSG